MNYRSMITLVVIFSGAVFMVWNAAVPADAENSVAVKAALTVSGITPLGAGEKGKTYSYVGSKKCKMCHLAIHKSWSKTKMGQAIEVLKPGNAKENKVKFNIDLTKDFSRDEKCVKCHTTGYGKPGGYVTPDLNDKKAVRRAKKLQGVGCESCHGPGSEYVKLHKEILKSKRKYTDVEMYAAGLQKIEKSTCLTCHNDESPTINKGDPFDYEKRKDQGVHKHTPLKQRDG